MVRPGLGQESVWDYPRPPRVEPITKKLRVEFGVITLAETERGLRVLETSSPPVYYFPPQDVRREFLELTSRTTLCEWKGLAKYWTIRVADQVVERAAWSYPHPDSSFEAIRDYVAFYPSKMEACYVGEQRAVPQTGDFYGGWITPEIVGPFKGDPGTEDW